MKREIGKNTLGGGKKMSIHLRNYERSSHDLSYVWRSTLAPGTIVPFMKKVGQRGDTFDINLELSVLTHPTVGPLFGQFKVQLDVFTADIRLYQAKLHNNALNIGLKMDTVKLPQLHMVADALDWTKDVNTQQINPSCIHKYLGISGIGHNLETAATTVNRNFNAIPYLAYWDIVKNYYANKQEEIAYVIHNSDVTKTITNITDEKDTVLPKAPEVGDIRLDSSTALLINYTGDRPNTDQIIVKLNNAAGIPSMYMPISAIFSTRRQMSPTQIKVADINPQYNLKRMEYWDYENPEENKKPQLVKFPLDNIDKMRNMILADVNNAAAFTITDTTIAPYGLSLKKEGTVWSKTTSQEGLALKTYQSDVLQNWIRTNFIEGSNSINEISAVQIVNGKFTIDDLTLKRKVYNMMNAVAISGGSYDDWQDVNYEERESTKPEIPEYHGGLSKEVIFQEVISNSANIAEGQPLGTLAGRGVLGKKHLGGYVRVKLKEAGYVMGMVSITPRIDYSQGNDWDTALDNMDDFHKPALDGIGFQDLVTEQMAFWDTGITPEGNTRWKSAGKQPSWINYMTSYNQTFGNFAIATQQMFMTLNRRYEQDAINHTIKDLTTYIDPQKYNHIFAYTKLDAQNFWVQIGVNIEARRLMSAKIMPQG